MFLYTCYRLNSCICRRKINRPVQDYMTLRGTVPVNFEETTTTKNFFGHGTRNRFFVCLEAHGFMT